MVETYLTILQVVYFLINFIYMLDFSQFRK